MILGREFEKEPTRREVGSLRRVNILHILVESKSTGQSPLTMRLVNLYRKFRKERKEHKSPP